MSARNVNLTARLADFIDRNVTSGRFQNASEVVREGLRLLERQQTEEDLKLEALRQSIELGRQDIAAGRTFSLQSNQVADFLRNLGDD